MPGDSTYSPDRPEAESQQTPAGAYGRLARRIAGWTSNLLVTAMIVVLALAVGRQLVGSYRAEPVKGDAGARPRFAPGLAEPDVPQFVEFGATGAVMGRQQFAGDTGAAAKALRSIARSLAANSAAPKTPLGATERQTLKTLARQKPVDAAGNWALYEMKPGYPMLLGVRRDGTSAPQDGSAGRVVLSAVGVPAGENLWTLYTFGLEGGETQAGDRAFGVPLPPGSRKGLAIRSASGAAVTSFKGTPEAAPCMAFYDQWFSARHWAAPLGWIQRAQAYQARFTPQQEGSASAVDIRLDGDGSGLVVVTP